MTAATIPLLKVGCRKLAIADSKPKVDIESRLVEFSFSSTRSVERVDWEEWKIFDEILSHDPQHVKVERVNEGVCPLLKDHHPTNRIGKVLKVWFQDDRGYAQAKISRCPDGDQLLRDLEDDIASGVSFAYRVYEYESIKISKKTEEKSVYKAVDWELLEISFVSIPADPTVGIGRSLDLDPNPVIIRGEFMPTNNNEEIAQLRSQLDQTNERLKQLDAALEKSVTHTQSLEAAIAQRDVRIQEMERNSQIATDYAGLRNQAEVLVRSAQLSKAEFDDIFAVDAQSDIQRLQKSTDCALEIGSVRFYLEKASKRSPLLQTEIRAGNEPIGKPEGTPPNDEDIEQEAKRLLQSVRGQKVVM